MSVSKKLEKFFFFASARYFRFFANFSLKRWHPKIIAVTGSVGKTTMLHLLEAELGEKAHYSHDANGPHGIAFDLVGVKGVTGSRLKWLYLIFAVPFRAIWFKHKEPLYVVEIDGARPGGAEFLAEWLRPDVTLWISLGRSHAEWFESQIREGVFEDLDKAITHEFAYLPQFTKEAIYIDKDVPLMNKAVKKVIEHHDLQVKVKKFSKNDLKSYKVAPESTDFGFKGISFHFGEPEPRDLAIQLLMLKSLSEALKMPLKTDFSGTVMPPGRSNFFKGKNGLKLIDSSYNAHLISMQSVLEMTKEMKTAHKWLIIGDIVDVGFISGDEHTKLAHLIAEAKPEQVITVGRRTKEYTAPVLKELKVPVEATNNAREALAYIKKHTTGKETLIFKGSQYLEWIIEKLLENPEDVKYLCRQDKAAKKRKEKRGLI